MSNLVVVAIPEKDDLVWEISSEKVPHLTLLFLGESGKVENLAQILQFLDHAAKTVLHRFHLGVDRRETLGDDKADVVFFEGAWDLPDLKRFRSQLLLNDNIQKAHLAVKQFPEWLPHLTLGYPATPARKPKDRYDKVHSVSFDRIALWVDDYEGPEFPLKRYEYPEAVSMSTTGTGRAAVADLLHYGTKGMKWGKRKDRSPTEVTVSRTKKGRARTEGGKNQPTHDDAVAAKVAAQKAKKSGLGALSNQELRTLAIRVNLEKQVNQLAGDQIASNGKQFVDLAMAVTAK